MRVPSDEAEEARELRRAAEAREILWEQILAARDRAKADLDAGRDDGAFNEAQLLLGLIQTWQA